ncbi:MAG: hypothetical protein LUF32_09610 [Clostridiales bacterium]|nr:hypothetical protein [Clostridiales bacterium]
MIIRNNKNIFISILLAAVLAFTVSGCTFAAGDMDSAADETADLSWSASVEDEAADQSDPAGNATQTEDVVSGEKYAYQTLDDETRQVYDEIVYSFSNREDVTVSTTDESVMELAYTAVRYDYCDFFWVDQLQFVQYSKGDEITSLEITPTWSMTEEEQAEIQLQIDAEANRMLADAPTDGSDFEKALYVYETLIREVDYNENASNSQNIISVFLNHETVCQGYAYATQYLLEKLGVACTTVIGSTDGQTHAWNLVVMDGQYYYIDTTWGNTQFIYRNENGEDLSEEDILRLEYLNYDYFGVTTEMLLMTHEPDSAIPLPTCTATADNYYVHEGLYVDAWDADVIGGIIRNGYENGEGIVRIRFSDRELCRQAEQYFLTDSHLFDYCGELQSVKYLQDSNSSVMVLVFS